jgi:signal transduction histidine kinase
MSKKSPKLGDRPACPAKKTAGRRLLGRLKIVFIIAVIVIPGFLLSFISLLSVRTKVYIWAVILLVIAIAGGVIIALRMVKREMALAQLKSDFVSNVSHELKTPLTSINMFVEMLLLKLYENEAEAEEYLRVIQKESNRLIHLVERVLDFSRIEKGKKEFHYKQESIREVILSTVETFRTQLVENECEITVNLMDNLPQLQIDRDAISEALLNLLNNAVKYSFEEKKVTINAQTVNNYVAIEVIDNGIGIPEHQQKKIFEPFYRVNDLLSVEVEGSGLGLAFVKYIAEAHGGKVTVQSPVLEPSVSLKGKLREGKVGYGSKFTLLLPSSGFIPEISLSY